VKLFLAGVTRGQSKCVGEIKRGRTQMKRELCEKQRKRFVEKQLTEGNSGVRKEKQIVRSFGRDAQSNSEWLFQVCTLTEQK
jgi:hypothetical protein